MYNNSPIRDIIYIHNRGDIMENVKELAKFILSLDKDDQVFHYESIVLNGRECLAGKVRLNKYLHIMQMMYISLYDQKLFNENMYAYDNGAVIDEILNSYAELRINRDNYSLENAENVKPFIKKMYEMLKPAPLDILIEISHQDEEWIKKHNYYAKSDQLMNIDSQKENYKELCADFIKLYKND